MKLRGRTNRFIVFLLSFLMAFEPFAINMVRAAETESVPQPVVEYLNTDGIEGIIDIEEVEKPVDYLDYMLSLRGRSMADDPITANNQDEAIAWGEWMNTLTGAYSLMDDGCTDVFSYYNTLGEVVPHLNNETYYFRALAYSANKATLAATFIANKLAAAFPGVVTAGQKIATGIANGANAVVNAIKGTVIYRKGAGYIQSKANLMNGLHKMGAAYDKTAQIFSAKNVTTFLTHMCPPVGFRAGCETGEGFVSYWRWIARKTHLDGNQGYKDAMKKINSHLSKENQICTNKGAKVMSDAKGIAHSVGIGLTIVGIALDTYGIVTSEDREGGRYGSYSLVKNYVGLALGVASLVAMFCMPVVGQIIGILALVWTGLTIIGDELGKYNKRWKAAYKDSYWYLYQNDPEFKSFYDNRESLTQNEKSAALLVTEKNYGEYREGASQFLAANKNEESYYDDKSQEAVSARVFIELEKQGVLMSYYNKNDFRLPDYSMGRLQEMWQMKADYMSWKPTEEESVREQHRGFWGKIGHAINPMTYISWAGDKIQSHEYKKMIENYNIEKVFFNPDYVLIKKYQNWITANRKVVPEESEDNNNDFYRAIGLRIEQSPFNYIPLVGIDMAAWTDDLLVEAFNADSFQIGVKEMMYFKNMIESAKDKVEEGTKNCTGVVASLKDSMEHFTYRAEALQALRDAYRNTPDDESRGKALMKEKCVKKSFGWKWNKNNGECTPRNIMKVYWNDINQCLTYDPLSVSQKGADCQLLLDTIKKNLDTAVLMNELAKEKRDALENFNSEFKNVEIAQYLKEGTFLDVKGSTFMDWLSDLYPAYDELEKHTKAYEGKVEDFQEAVNESNEGHKKIFGITFSDDKYHPNNILKEINSVLNMYKNVAEDFEDITSDLSVDGLAITADDEKVYTDYAQRELVALDPEKPVQIDMNASVIPEGDND